jgi:ankyrin repeat protein
MSNNYGMTPLHLASKLGLLEICRFLCKFVLTSNAVDNNGKTALDLAISEQKWEIVFSDLFW